MSWIEEIKAGNEEELKKNFEKYQPVVLKASQEFFLRHFDFDDWMQEGLIVFYRSVLTYKENLGVSFGLYFKNNFHRHIISLIRKQKALKRKSEEDTFSLDDDEKREGVPRFMEGQIMKEDVTEKMVVKECTTNFYETLSSFDRKVMILYEKGFDIDATACLLGTTERKVKKSIQKTRMKLKKELKKNLK